MEAIYIRDRVELWRLKKENPGWTKKQLSEKTGRSLSWVKKWLRRFRKQPPEEYPEVFFSRSRAPHEPQKKVTGEICQRILDIRDNPPENLRRTPGPVAILYYLPRQRDFIEAKTTLPTSIRTIWKVLREAGRIARPEPRKHQPIERPEPDEVWAMDYKDISSVKKNPGEMGKKQHLVESLNLVDEGTSRWVDAQVRGDYSMETSIKALFSTFLLKGYPKYIKMDRDPRFIGSWSANEFPSPLMRFLMCLNIETIILPPRRPDKNPFVERMHRSLKEEALLIEKPATLEQAIDVVEAYHHHYNHERPNQALSCGNQPPLVAYPDLPALRSLPSSVDPDSWLDKIHTHTYKRKINANGSVKLGNHSYYVKRALAGQKIAIIINAVARELNMVHQSKVIKTREIKGLFHGRMNLSAFLKAMIEEARTIDKRLRYVS
jgi:transposase